MSFLPNVPVPVSAISALSGEQPTSFAPIYTNLPRATSTLANTYTKLAPDFRTLPSDLVASYQQYQSDRLARGSSPLNVDQSRNVLASALTGQPVTQAPQPKHGVLNLFGNAVNDLANIVTSVPRIPDALYQAAVNIPHLPSEVSQELSQPHPIAALATNKTLSLIPGLHTLGDITSGDFADIAQHPLMTALDVLPAAHTLGVTDAIANSAVGDLARKAADAFTTTRPGLAIQTAFGSGPRALSSLESAASHDMLHGPVGDPASGLTEARDNVMALLKDYPDDAIPPVRKAALTKQLELQGAAPVLNSPDLTDVERSYVQRYVDLNDTFGNFKAQQGSLEARVINGQSELLAPEQARALDARRAVAARADALTQLRAHVQAASALPEETRTSPAGIGYAARTASPTSLGSPAALDDLWSGTVKPWLEQSKTYVSQGTGQKEALNALQGFKHAVMQSGKVLPGDIQRLIDARDVNGAINAFDALHDQSFQSLGDQAPTAQQNRAASSWADRQSKFTLKRAAAAQSRLSAYEMTNKSAVPARFQPYVEQATREGAANYVSEHVVDPEAAARAVQWATEGRYSTLISQGAIDLDNLKAVQSEVLGTLADMRRNGYDPVFVHHLAPADASVVNYPHALDYVPRPSSTKIRALTLDATPNVNDMGIALAHDVMEHVQRAGTVNFLRTYLDTGEGGEGGMFAKSQQALHAQYEDAARTLASRDPRLDTAGHLERLIGKEWTRVDVNSTVPADLKAELGITGDDLGANHPYVPKAVARAFDQLKAPKSFGIFDPITAAYRTALLPLSPRYWLHATVGGMMMLMGQTDPAVFAKLGDAYELTKAMRDGTWSDLPVEKQPPSTMRAAFGSTKDLPMEWQWRAGNQLGEMGKRVGETSGAKMFQTMVAKGYDLTSFVHDMYRSLGYLYGYDKGLTRGMTEDAAKAAGESLARRTMMSWDTMTPFERTTIRSIFPFYGFASHVLQYAWHYPEDHPFRVAVTSSIARNEVNDLSSGLPQSLLASMFLGHPDANGNIKELSLGTLNPFKDVATYTTLQGWANSMNPVFETALQQLGVDTSNGGPQLYPNMTYDPTSGRLVASSKNPFLNLLNNTIPQSSVVSSVLNSASEVKALARTDPGAAQRLIASQLGIPVVYRTRNLFQQQFGSELQREQGQQAALSGALKSGNDATANRWPALQPVLANIRALQASGQLDAFTSSPLNAAVTSAQSGQAAAIGG